MSAATPNVQAMEIFYKSEEVLYQEVQLAGKTPDLTSSDGWNNIMAKYSNNKHMKPSVRGQESSEDHKTGNYNQLSVSKFTVQKGQRTSVQVQSKSYQFMGE